MAKGPVFLERQSYRRRRVMDAIRLLPVLGLAIWMVPLLWPVTQGAQDGLQTSDALRYLFGGWIILVAIGWGLWARRQRQAASTPTKRA